MNSKLCLRTTETRSFRHKDRRRQLAITFFTAESVRLRIECNWIDALFVCFWAQECKKKSWESFSIFLLRFPLVSLSINFFVQINCCCAKWRSLSHEKCFSSKSDFFQKMLPSDRSLDRARLIQKRGNESPHSSGFRFLSLCNCKTTRSQLDKLP